MTDALGAWREFHVAMLGATAALAGLVIVTARSLLAIVVAIVISWIALVEVLR